MGDDAEGSEMDEDGAWGSASSATRLGNTEPHSLSSRNTSDILGRSGATANHAPLMLFSLLFSPGVPIFLPCVTPQILCQEQKIYKPVYL